MRQQLDGARNVGSRSLDQDAGKQLLGFEPQDGSSGVPRPLFSAPETAPPQTFVIEEDAVSVPTSGLASVGGMFSRFARQHPAGAAILVVSAGVVVGNAVSAVLGRLFGGR